MEEDKLTPDTRERYEAYVRSMRNAASPEWANMYMSVKAARDFYKGLDTELPETWETIEAAIRQDIKNPAYSDMYIYMITNIPLDEAQLKALKWVFPASWRGRNNDLAVFTEAYLRGYSYFFDEMRDEQLNYYAPYSLNYEQQIARYDEVAKEHIKTYLESRYPRIKKQLQRAIRKAVVLLFVADNVDETGIGEIYNVAKEAFGLQAGKTLTPKDKAALNTIAELIIQVVEFWALNFCKWAGYYIWGNENTERQFISEAEAEPHEAHPYLFNEVAAVFGQYIVAYHKAAVAGIQHSGEDYLNTDYEALLPAIAEEWDATERIGGYNALMDKVKNSRYNEYYTAI